MAEHRNNLLETLADVDDEFAEIYLEHDEVPEEAIHVGALGVGCIIMCLEVEDGAENVGGSGKPEGVRWIFLYKWVV